jgi:replicative DNA helicase
MAGTVHEALEKPVPYDLDAEEAVLGSLLIDRDAIIPIATFVRPEDFYRESNRWVYQVFLDLYNRREPGDLVTVSSELERQGRLDSVGGPAHLASLVNCVPTSVHVEYYAHVVERCSIMRRLIRAGAEIAALAYDDSGSVEAVLGKAQQVLYGVSTRRSALGFQSVRDVLEQYFDKLDSLHEHKGQIVGVPTGFHDLDQLTGGLQKSDLVVLAARPGAGKTSLALSMAHNAAVKRNTTVGIFSLEMSAEQLVQRLLAMETGVDSQRLRLGYINEDEWVDISRAFGRLAEAHVFVDDTAGLSAMELRSKARRLQAEAGVGLVIVDYLQLMQGSRTENRVQEISDITRSLKEMARELNVPVIAVSQLSRAVESRESHVPKLSDLRESGSIEQDADIVMFIYREELYKKDTDRKGIVELHVSKHRNGPTGVVSLRFFEKTTRFADLEVYRQPG